MNGHSSHQCFACSAANPKGLHLEFVIDVSPEGEVTSRAAVNLGRSYEGGAGNLHGGIIATLLDESMSKLNKPLGTRALTRRLQVDYLQPCPVDADLHLTARNVRREGRKLFHAAELLNAEGEVLARAEALFISIAGTAH